MNLNTLLQDRQSLAKLALLIGVVLAYLMISQSQRTTVTTLQQDLNNLQSDLLWMEQLPAAMPINEPDARVYSSLTEQIEQTSRQYNLVSTIRRIEPNDENSVSIQLESPPFSAMLQWIHTMATEHGLSVQRLLISKGSDAQPLRVNLALERPGL